MYCEKCDKHNEIGAVVCSGCGNKLDKVTSQNQDKTQSQPKTVDEMMKLRYGTDYKKEDQKERSFLSTGKIIGIILMLLGVFVILVSVISKGNLVEAVVPSVLMIIIGFALLLYRKKAPNSKNKNSQTAKVGEGVLKVFLPLFYGLPLPQNTFADVRVFNESLEINANGIQFILDNSKIQDISIKTNTEINKQYVSSIGGAVGGAVLFGPLGAMIGGRAKEKKSKTINTYLIITYLKDGAVDYIAFDVTNNVREAEKLIKACQNKINPIVKRVSL